MKKVIYFILLIVEMFVGSLFMISLWDSSIYLSVAVAVAAVLGLLIWQLVRYARNADVEVRRKILRNIAFIMLIPIAVFIATYVVVAIAFIFAFA